MAVNWKTAQARSAKTAKWAVTMTKVRIRQVLSRTRWQLITFCGPAGGESVGIVDLLAVRKDHGKPLARTKRGDTLQLVFIQVKGGRAPMPTAEDGERLRVVARHHRARQVMLATWRKGEAAHFFRLRKRYAKLQNDWTEVENIESVFK